MKRKRIDIITLGCSKNLVDSEQLMRQLEEAGYSVTHDTEKPEGEIAVINTCGFIGDAKEESINMILEFAERKEEGDLKKLFVMGCLSERYLQELAILKFHRWISSTVNSTGKNFCMTWEKHIMRNYTLSVL